MSMLIGTRRALAGRNRLYYAKRWGVVAHWPLNEASGTASDDVGGNTLTDNNTVTSAAGKVYGTARQFTAVNSEYLSRVDNAALSAGDVDFWLSAWVYGDTLGGGSPCILSRFSANQEYAVDFDGTNRFRFYVSATGSGVVIVNAAALGAPSIGTWYFLLAWHDSVNNTINIRANHGTVNSAAHSTGVFDGDAQFRIGSRQDLGRYWDGRLGPVAIGKSPPGGIAGVINEISERLYAGGVGRSHPWI